MRASLAILALALLCPTAVFATCGDPDAVCAGGDCCAADCLSFVPAGTVCRSAAGVCDLYESCDGTTADCPVDVKSTAVCRSAAGDCDIAESCDGTNVDCPPDGLAPATTVCRSSAGACDVAE